MICLARDISSLCCCALPRCTVLCVALRCHRCCCYCCFSCFSWCLARPGHTRQVFQALQKPSRDRNTILLDYYYYRAAATTTAASVLIAYSSSSPPCYEGHYCLLPEQASETMLEATAEDAVVSTVLLPSLGPYQKIRCCLLAHSYA